MRRTSLILTAFLLCRLSAFAGMPVNWSTDRYLKAPEATPLVALDTLGIKAVLLEGPEYKGEKTRFFAYYALPEGADDMHKVPAMVLIHGGGGSAFWEWVKVWRDRGYAAIAMDTTGKLPIRVTGDPFHKTFGNWTPLQDAIQLDWGGFARGRRAVEEQWPFCAVAEVMLSHAFIASLPEVDADHIGVTGNSWGGFLTLLSAAADPGFAFAAPVYACGYYEECPVLIDNLLGDESCDAWLKLWDPKYYIPSIKMPLVWAAGTNDFAFEFGALQKSFALAEAPVFRAVRYKMQHTDGHQEGGRPIETFAAADHFLKGNAGLPQVGMPERKGRKLTVSFDDAGRNIKKYELLYTTSSEGMWTKRPWTVEQLPEQKHKGQISAAIPEEAVTLFFNITTEEGLVASSPAITLQ